MNHRIKIRASKSKSSPWLAYICAVIGRGRQRANENTGFIGHAFPNAANNGFGKIILVYVRRRFCPVGVVTESRVTGSLEGLQALPCPHPQRGFHTPFDSSALNTTKSGEGALEAKKNAKRMVASTGNAKTLGSSQVMTASPTLGRCGAFWLPMLRWSRCCRCGNPERVHKRFNEKRSLYSRPLKAPNSWPEEAAAARSSIRS